MLRKQVVLKVKNVYTAHAFSMGRGFYLGAGSETEPVVQLYDLASAKTESIGGCPGGMMSFIPVPAQEYKFVSIMGLFPPFIGGEAGLYLHQRDSSGWKTTKAMSLPFAHRCEFISNQGEVFLLAATVSQHKENPPDWSRPGELHLIPIGNPVADSWESEILNLGITRNHGMVKATLDGKEQVFVSGEQGVFSLGASPHHAWELTPVFEKEVSEVNFLDLDGDGNSEMITIEPFHGPTLNVYKRIGASWEQRFSAGVSFGHGLSSGIFNGNPVFVAGNRSESLALEIFTVDNLSKGLINRKVIEMEAGPTQTQVFNYHGTNYILSANQKKNEVALYTGTLD